MPARTPKNTIKVRSRFKVGQDVWIKAKVTHVREDDLGRPQLVVLPPHAMAPIRVREEDASEDKG